MTRPVLKVSFIALLTITFVSCTGWAQNVLPKSVEASGTVGFTSNGGADNNVHTNLGAAGGYNLYGNLTVLGEVTHLWLGSTNTVRVNAEHYGGGARYYLLRGNRFNPYVVGSGGFERYETTVLPPNSAAVTHVTTGQNAGYFTAGGGLSIYGGDNWGIRPELRYQRELLGVSGSGFNVVEGSLSVFFQFGGTESKKK